ncbi:competence protein TfoX [bacterium (Candidatus Blackallbacteria) CG17_big_fil_post_rev_8_21_14_2_50_48_46]|uniref:Competence protein TfoX n=1 Tax=bacterium (Candidatus Blackallbacteria) CG17_big_fil_post_rev_8_21_14_2_50_48_46 TaxID=2014261 RepID=A0A2M7G161_9BACT|nr:MAG: competence protein TfoX [bacterium (Candidatus Blackallbacteria) CG18_big_fil_WC_8_21_14_2_50_49_26]PIW15277.1 MAG: competence protein TfoX [bacterium (Candidatus Blackallbacteria) CG17_big_fil_post_rev_8_21_14_2_50_48_46]PIW45214.1 MAG: competence protein TfoX [bacterium (Candidatus Blackallbacteria) CG13_big_fil_rev_8_21_14_2_50_49_14]
MPTDKAWLETLLKQLDLQAELSAKAMFGEYALYAQAKIVALLADNQLFVKPTEAGRAFIQTPIERSPYPGAKPCFLIQEPLKDPAWLRQLIQITTQELPAPKPKKPTQRKTKS